MRSLVLEMVGRGKAQGFMKDDMGWTLRDPGRTRPSAGRLHGVEGALELFFDFWHFERLTVALFV